MDWVFEFYLLCFPYVLFFYGFLLHFFFKLLKLFILILFEGNQSSQPLFDIFQVWLSNNFFTSFGNRKAHITKIHLSYVFGFVVEFEGFFGIPQSFLWGFIMKHNSFVIFYC